MSFGQVAVVDYGLCNIDSITRMLEELGATVEKTRDPRVVERADRIVLPGVGAFGRAMENLTGWGLAQVIQDRVEVRGIPFLGICLGMQLMAKEGSEHGRFAGLGLVDAVVERLRPNNPQDRVPHIGWNEVHQVSADCPLFRGVIDRGDFYFVHSYSMKPVDTAVEVGRTPYCGSFTSVVQVPGRPVFGTQFHPEKSQRIGRRLLANFLSL